MFKKYDSLKKIFAIIFTCSIVFCFFDNAILAANYESLSTVTYTVDASLECYVNAMGGIEFGAPLLESASIAVDTNGTRICTLHFTKSTITIYNISCDTFIDANPSSQAENNGVKSGTIGYYDASGNLQTDDVSYTLSEDTALNAANEEVRYVQSISFPLTYESDTYHLSLYINSNVMGVQFCNSNDNGNAASYPATLSLNWNSIQGQADQTASVETASQNNKQAVIVEEEGLNIHYANGDASVNESISYTAYLNTQALTILAVCAGALVVLGIALLISTKKTKKEKI